MDCCECKIRKKNQWKNTLCAVGIGDGFDRYGFHGVRCRGADWD